MATNTPVLLKVFDAAIAEKLMPVFEPLGACHLVGESCYEGWPRPSTLKPRRYEDLDGRFFWWINRFIIGDATLDIAYGDREFLIETMLFYAGIPDRFAPWELLTAAEVPNPHVVSGESFVLTPDFIVRVIDGMADGLRQHWNVLGTPAPQIIDRARVLRGKRMIFAQEEQRRQDRERATIEASTAFHSGRYAEAKSLLEQFRQDADLTRSAAKILELAERKLK